MKILYLITLDKMASLLGLKNVGTHTLLIRIELSIVNFHRKVMFQ
ncbi:hypothetical protein LEP1GSC083_1801 [Leptospira interrogans serovar Pyrogenes str. L0374]|uniref:Uncharacterized protein n=3 Tax=Leptospira interrogans TaxID=173 RepID=M7ACD2_LEPIR|nr:hypothetical protein LEP1GSC037_4865 [Leptospira interrogans str. 2006001854]EMN30035.1 hypothetical protein LEP1GSC083_1801 [Leptospira interrogans serovar Pyrogenes str. L0374]EMP08464.1 hypothetical protein LEP1GSC124_1127 [Leptospira interrogans serovar Pyrogenes str. 200701872]